MHSASESATSSQLLCILKYFFGQHFSSFSRNIREILWDMPYNFGLWVMSHFILRITIQRQNKAHSINSCPKMQTRMSYLVDNVNCRRHLNYGIVYSIPVPILLSTNGISLPNDDSIQQTTIFSDFGVVFFSLSFYLCQKQFGFFPLKNT